MASSVFELLHILNGHKESSVFSLFVNAINSRANPNSVEVANRSSLSTNLCQFPSTSLIHRTVTSLFEAFIAFLRQIELSSVSEINADCLSFLKDCTTNSAVYKNNYSSILRLATVYGEKLDDSVIADKRKMRKEFGVDPYNVYADQKDLYIRLLTLLLNQNPHGRASSSDGRRVNIYQTETARASDDEAYSKPGTPGKDAFKTR